MKRLPVITERALGDVKALQIQIDHEYELRMRQQGMTPSCKKGCTHCCSHPFLVTIAEGVILYRWLRANHKWTPALRRHIEETRGEVLGQDFEVWLLKDIPCPLLSSDKTCSAYEARPLRCRVTYSTGDPSMCRPNELGPRTPLVPNADTVIEFTRASLAALKKAGVNDGYLMPMAEALLLAEAVDTGKLDIKNVDLQHMKDLLSG
jgi:Fe-S-cluster containining protein